MGKSNTDQKLIEKGNIIGTGRNIAYLYRIAPRLQWHLKNMLFAAELEYTAAAYGNPDDEGMVQNAKEVGNLRVLVGVFYFF